MTIINGLRRARLLLRGIAGVALLLTPVAALAQQVPTPGQVKEQLKPPRTLPSTPSAPLVPQAPQPATSGVVPGGTKVVVARFDISGNTAFASDELQAVVASYVGRPLTLFEIYDAADQITRHYRTHGYILASATVPVQKIASGAVRLEVLEGRLSAVTVEGNKHLRADFVNWQLDSLKQGAVLQNAPIEHELLLLNDLPGLEARALIKPGAEFGTSDLVVQTEEKVLEGNVRVNNYGRESIGEWRLEGGAALNGLLGVGDRFEFSGAHAEANLLNYARAGYSMPVSPWGTVASVFYSTYDYEADAKQLGLPEATTRIEGEGDNFGASLLHPYWRTRTMNLYFGVGYDRTVTEQLTNVPDQNLTLGIFNALFDYTAPDGSYSSAGATFSTNFNGMERDPTTLLLENNAETVKLQLDLSHYRTLHNKLSMLARFTGVGSVDPLSDLDQFRLGGQGSVRAYPSSEYSGDSGFLFSFELIHPLPLITVAPTVVKGFIDTGRVFWKNHELLGDTHGSSANHGSRSLTGIGLGLQTSAYKHFLFDVSLAQPLGAHEASDNDHGVRFWASVSANF
ncbi:MAG: ShlB/FhaC/HecB family hemolysin secretion/activation protein [Gammaproteobacteria bacterium]|nr:ShlB/FhaC/HecB family hemolysin secretion/activation protein [Gammaproteobacteria bacterium]